MRVTEEVRSGLNFRVRAKLRSRAEQSSFEDIYMETATEFNGNIDLIVRYW